uniref:ORF369 n=1 Tax=Pseudococcomyxa simplex TaxID=464287 RepID=A0A109QJ06_9CHLO|nr:ORF369 [Pseudococcomyxa simplex]
MNFDAKKIKLEVGFYLAGFTDAEGCFHVGFSPKRNQNNEITSWKVNPLFAISQKERHIVAQFKKHLKCGTVSTNEKTNVSTYRVSNVFSLREYIVPFFKKFSFQSAKKKRDFSNFIQVLEILENSIDPSCPSKEDIERILALRVNTKAIVANRIYSDEVILSSLEKTIHIDEIKQSSETNTPNSERLQGNVILNEMIESDLYGDVKAENALSVYIAGFADGDGSFNVSFRKRDDYSIGWKINPSFSIAQRDRILLQLFQKQLNCGKIRKGSSEGIYYLEVLDLNDLRTKIVPFFKKYPLLSEKGREKFQKFYKTLDLLSLYPVSRATLEEILQLQRNENSKTRYTPQQILDRFDEYALQKEIKTQQKRI